MKKNRSYRDPQSSLNAAEKQTIRTRFNNIKQEWCLALEEDPIDWQHLFDLHWEMYKLERSHPWVKKAVA